MQKIDIVGLGGMNEIGRKLYVFESGKDIFIFDAGMKFPEDIMFGIDKIIPDFTYLKNNKKRVKAIFISNISDENIGALSMLMQVVDAPICGSKFTVSVLKRELANRSQVFQTLIPMKKYKFGGITISAFSMTFSLPGNLGFLIETPNGNFSYISDYVFNNNVTGLYETNYEHLASLRNANVLALISPVKGAETNGYGVSQSKFSQNLENSLQKTSGAVFINTFTKNFLIIQKAIIVAEKVGRKVCVIGKKGYELINIAIRSHAIKIERDTLVSAKRASSMKTKEIMYLVLGDEGMPFDLMLDILSDANREVRVQKNDKAYMVVPKIPGSELKISKVIDELFKKGIPTEIIDFNNISINMAGVEDMKLLYNFIKPKYLIATDGENRQIVEFENKMSQFGVDPQNIILCNNGEWISFVDGEHTKSELTNLVLEEILVNGNVLEDSDNYILKEREQLSADGVVILTVALLEKVDKYEAQYVNYQSLGFIPAKDQKVLIAKIKESVVAVVESSNTSNSQTRINELKRKIQEAINQTIYREIKRHPVVVIQFILQKK